MLISVIHKNIYVFYSFLKQKPDPYSYRTGFLSGLYTTF